jgi:membrane protein
MRRYSSSLMSEKTAPEWDEAGGRFTLTYRMLEAAGKEYGEDRVGRMSAAVAYRAIFALAPLLLVAVSVFGIFVGSSETAQAEILDAVNRFAGSDVEQAVSSLLVSVEKAKGVTGTIVGFVLLLWTSSSLFSELQNDLNDIFHVPYEATSGVIAFIRKRGIGFLAALGLGFLLIAVWLLNLLWNMLEGLFPESWNAVHTAIGVLTPLVSLVVLPLVVALAFQVLSRVKMRWRAIWWGSFFTAVAFLAAAYGTGLYFNYAGTSAAGLAGSVFVILLLAYVLSAVFLFGAEITKVHNDYLETGEVVRSNLRERDDSPDMVVGQPEPPVPLAAVLGFLGGLFVGWRRKG